MKRIHIFLVAFIIITITACKKEDVPPAPLPAERIALQRNALQDTLQIETNVNKDSAIVIGFKAVLKGELSNLDHTFKLSSDTARMAEYRAKYGDARILPYKNFVFIRSLGHIMAGTSISDSIQLNIVGQTMLQPLSEYVLPIVFKEVDGGKSFVPKEEVVFLIVKTGKKTAYSKSDWSIIAESAGSNTAYATIDIDPDTYWSSGSEGDRFCTIDFGRETTFSGLSYKGASAFYGTGAYPINVKIEVSMDGTNWQDKGLFTGAVPPATSLFNLGTTSARYLKYSVISFIPWYFGQFSSPFFQQVFISDISLIP